MNLTISSNGQTVTATITDEAGNSLDFFQVKDGAGFLGRVDRKLANLLWERGAFQADMTATVTRPALYDFLTAVNAR